jgi:hypothetical protein
MIDFQEDSLPYYQGGAIRPAEENYFTTTPPERWTPWIVLTDKVWKKLDDTTRSHLVIVGRVRGLDYADRGRIVEVLVVRRR